MDPFAHSGASLYQRKSSFSDDSSVLSLPVYLSYDLCFHAFSSFKMCQKTYHQKRRSKSSGLTLSFPMISIKDLTVITPCIWLQEWQIKICGQFTVLLSNKVVNFRSCHAQSTTPILPMVTH